MQPVHDPTSSASTMTSKDITPSPLSNPDLPTTTVDLHDTTPTLNSARNLVAAYKSTTTPPNDNASPTILTNDGTTAPSPAIQLTSDQLADLRELHANGTPPPFITPPNPTTDDDSYKILLLEHLASTGLTTKFNGNPIQFPSFLKKVSQRCKYRLLAQSDHAQRWSTRWYQHNSKFQKTSLLNKLPFTGPHLPLLQNFRKRILLSSTTNVCATS